MSPDPLPNEIFGLDASFLQAKSALFLDLDGTLIDIAQTPQGVVTPPGLVHLLARLSKVLDGALAIVTGRPIADVDRLLFPLRPRAAGVHGAEIRAEVDGDVQLIAAKLDPWLVSAVNDIADLDPGIIVEPKGASIAVHYRLAEDEGSAIEQRLRGLVPEGPHGVEMRPGRKVAELIDRQVSKGAALNSFMQKPPFADRRPIMIGDDRTDLSAFAAAERLGGKSLRVAGEFFGREAADFGGTAEVRQFLSALADVIAASKGESSS